ncbi:hypothetical protein QFZ55_006164 [Streptomyces luteogriseus]|uniref:hypothetical protein n=1 Tax=Streptomyces luteogriseus TaxID=68233 RepID=UPI002783A5A8|nr:hypothetical protein [Streptomyces luteogriseus]MDQ0716712.1 hypothetical protein [Streptomyces luteogriseus]
MRERSDGVEESSEDVTEGPKRIDLNVPQVAGGAVAVVLAAKLASYFGVYGTILGAGVVSVVATCGGTLFQHFFKRTGEQIRGATAVAARPSAGPAGQAPSRPGEFTEGTVYRARARSWKRPVLAAVAVFGVTMAGITTYELVSGHNLSGGRSTTVGDAFSRGGASSTDSGDSGGSGGSDSSTSDDSSISDDPGTEDAPTADPSGSGTSQRDNPSPSTSGSGRTTPSPTPTPSATGSEDAGSTTPGATPTPPEPSASSRSGTADQDRDDPAAP